MNNNLETNWQAKYSAIIEAGTAKSTRRAYARNVIYFWRWSQLALQQTEHYPISEESVIRS